MKLSKETINILKNFKTINKSIVIRSGNIINTRPNKTSEANIAASATVKEDFPYDMGIYDLTHFINVVENMGDCDLEIAPDSSSIIIKSGKNTIKYNLSVIDLLSP